MYFEAFGTSICNSKNSGDSLLFSSLKGVGSSSHTPKGDGIAGSTNFVGVASL